MSSMDQLQSQQQKKQDGRVITWTAQTEAGDSIAAHKPGCGIRHHVHQAKRCHFSTPDTAAEHALLFGLLPQLPQAPERYSVN
jgi:hypothetical protein